MVQGQLPTEAKGWLEWGTRFLGVLREGHEGLVLAETRRESPRYQAM